MAAGKEQKKDRRDEKGIIKENEAGGEAARPDKHKSQSRFVRGDTSLVQGRKEGTGAFGWS